MPELSSQIGVLISNGWIEMQLTCGNCSHQGRLELKNLKQYKTVEEVDRRLKCSKCAGKQVARVLKSAPSVAKEPSANRLAKIVAATLVFCEDFVTQQALGEAKQKAAEENLLWSQLSQAEQGRRIKLARTLWTSKIVQKAQAVGIGAALAAFGVPISIS